MLDTITILTACKVQVQVTRDLGLTFVSPLTRCCSAVVTGVAITDDCPTGVACKGCGATFSPGWAGADWFAVLVAVTEAGCPCPSDCTDLALLEIQDRD